MNKCSECCVQWDSSKLTREREFDSSLEPHADWVLDDVPCQEVGCRQASVGRADGEAARELQHLPDVPEILAAAKRQRFPVHLHPLDPVLVTDGLDLVVPHVGAFVEPDLGLAVGKLVGARHKVPGPLVPTKFMQKLNVAVEKSLPSWFDSFNCRIDLHISVF